MWRQTTRHCGPEVSWRRLVFLAAVTGADLGHFDDAGRFSGHESFGRNDLANRLTPARISCWDVEFVAAVNRAGDGCHVQARHRRLGGIE